MAIGILSLVRVSAERLAAFNAAGYTVLETAKYASRLEALQAAGKASVGIRAVLTNGRGGISAAEMDLLPKLIINRNHFMLWIPSMSFTQNSN